MLETSTGPKKICLCGQFCFSAELQFVCHGFSVLLCFQVQRRLGYCPQFDALIDRLTGRETLLMYARLRGVSQTQIHVMTQQLIETLLLQEHADKLVSSYR